MKTKHIALAAALVAMMVSCGKKPEPRYEMTEVTRGDITTSVTATGTIEPVTKVEVGTQVSGIIDKIYVDYNSIVHKGDVIAELDKTNLLSELQSMQSNLANAESKLTYQKANYERYRTLYEKGLVSANDYEQAKLSYDQALQQTSIEKQNLQKAKTNLGYATITAPIDGVVLSKEVEEGQTVASAMTTPTLFIIAQDLTDMRVIANVDEADIGEVKEGQRVTFTVDAYPDDVFEGVVTQVRQEATTTSNVVTYEVVISAPNNDLKLKPGLTASVNIFTLEKKDVLVVQSKALRFTPAEELLKPDQKIVDCDQSPKLWRLEGDTFRAFHVETGTQGGNLTEILSGAKEGEKVILDMDIANIMKPGSGSKNPFMPGPPKKENKDKKESK